jgi:hypothetical protein
MLVTKKYNVYARDFDAELTCDFCDHKQEYKSGYDDAYWWQSVCPTIKCKACGKSTKQEQVA